MQYSNRLNQVELCCGNVHSLEEKMTTFVHGLDPAIGPLVARHRESHRMITYLEVVHFARGGGNASRVRSAHDRRPNIVFTLNKSILRKERASAMMTHSDEDFLATHSIWRAFDNNVDRLQYIGGAEDSFPTTYLPTAYDTAFEDLSREEDAIFALEQRRHILSPVLLLRNIMRLCHDVLEGWRTYDLRNHSMVGGRWYLWPTTSAATKAGQVLLLGTLDREATKETPETASQL